MPNEIKDEEQGEIALLGIPFDLGAGQPGAIMGPTALRLAGIADGLRELGYDVTDHGDLSPPGAASLDFPVPPGAVNEVAADQDEIGPRIEFLHRG